MSIFFTWACKHDILMARCLLRHRLRFGCPSRDPENNRHDFGCSEELFFLNIITFLHPPWIRFVGIVEEDDDKSCIDLVLCGERCLLFKEWPVRYFWVAFHYADCGKGSEDLCSFISLLICIFWIWILSCFLTITDILTRGLNFSEKSEDLSRSKG